MRQLSHLKILNDTGATKVSLVKDLDNGQYYIEKRLTVSISFQKELFENEIFIHSQMKHRYVIGFEERTGEDSFLLEYAPRGDLSFFFTEKKRHIKWCIQFLKGLNYLHRLGYVHNDIKPSNIILDREFRAKLSDFAFSGKIGEKSFENMPDYFIPGSDYFRSDKQSRDRSNAVDNDIYAVGKVLYLLFSGDRISNPVNLNLIPHDGIRSITENCLNGTFCKTEEIIDQLVLTDQMT